MMILWRERLAFLAVPKTGTTAIESILAPFAAITYSRPPMVKHMTLSKFNRFLRPYLENSGLSDVKTLAVMREQVSWLGSWYRYRQRDGLKNTAKSTAHLSFDEFVLAYLSERGRPDFAEVGSQARFLSGCKNGNGVDHLFCYERMEPLVGFLTELLGQPMEFPKLNVSPRMPLSLSEPVEQRLREKHADDFALYASLLH